MKDLQVQLVWPPVLVRRAPAGSGFVNSACYQTLAIFTHLCSPFLVRFVILAAWFSAKLKTDPAGADFLRNTGVRKNAVGCISLRKLYKEVGIFQFGSVIHSAE
jgi:hypothetical protein